MVKTLEQIREKQARVKKIMDSGHPSARLYPVYDAEEMEVVLSLLDKRGGA